MANIEVKINYNDGTHDYDLPLVYHISDPQEGMKAVVIKGNRGDGSIVIPGGKKSQYIRVAGKLYGADYIALTTLISEMRTNVTTDLATITMKHKVGINWITDWSYTVRRIKEIEFSEGLRTDIQEYEVEFLVIAY